MLKLKWRLTERNLQWNFFTLSFKECSVEVRWATDFATAGKNSDPYSSIDQFRHFQIRHVSTFVLLTIADPCLLL